MKYWINVVSKDHVMRGVNGGFTQANHGKPYMLKRMKKSDWLLFYSPRTEFESGTTLQAFTAIGQVADDDPYQFEVSAEFKPWRRKMNFYECHEAPIKPLIDQLEFIQDKSHWGYKFRFGVFEIEQNDFKIIAAAMGARHE